MVYKPGGGGESRKSYRRTVSYIEEDIRKDERNIFLKELIERLDNPANFDLDCNTTDDWYGYGWDDCRANIVNFLKSLRDEQVIK